MSTFDRGRDRGTNFILRTKEQETRLNLHEHDDDDDNDFTENGNQPIIILTCYLIVRNLPRNLAVLTDVFIVTVTVKLTRFRDKILCVSL